MTLTVAKFLGAVLLGMGALGFFSVPAQMDFRQSLLHLATGCALLLIVTSRPALAEKTLTVVGIAYGIVAFAGFMNPNQVAGSAQWLQLAIAAICVFLGSAAQSDKKVTNPAL